MFSQRSFMRFFQCLRSPPPCRWKPPKRILLRTIRPIACQNVIMCQPKISGIRAFHNPLTTKPNTVTATRPIRNTLATFAALWEFIFVSLPTCKIFVNRLQSASEMKDRVMFAREQRVDAQAGVGGYLLKTAAFEFVRDEDIALHRRKLFEGIVERINQQVARVGRFRAGLSGGQKVFEHEHVVCVSCARWFVEGAGFLSAEEVDHTITGDAKEPCGYMFDRLHEAVGLEEFVEDILQDIFGVSAVGHILANKAAQSRLVPFHGLREELVLLDDRPIVARHLRHLLVLTDERGEYFMDCCIRCTF